MSARRGALPAGVRVLPTAARASERRGAWSINVVDVKTDKPPLKSHQPRLPSAPLPPGPPGRRRPTTAADMAEGICGWWQKYRRAIKVTRPAAACLLDLGAYWEVGARVHASTMGPSANGLLRARPSVLLPIACPLVDVLDKRVSLSPTRTTPQSTCPPPRRPSLGPLVLGSTNTSARCTLVATTAMAGTGPSLPHISHPARARGAPEAVRVWWACTTPPPYIA